MSQILSGIIIAVISGWILSLFGIGNSKTVVRINNGQAVSKKWKITIVFGWLMFIGGGYYFLAWLSVLGFANPKTGIGFSISILGLFLLLFGKFGSWWNRSW